MSRKTFAREVRGTADPSTALRFGRDDKGEGGASIELQIAAERTAGPSASLHHPATRDACSGDPDFASVGMTTLFEKSMTQEPVA